MQLVTRQYFKRENLKYLLLLKWWCFSVCNHHVMLVKKVTKYQIMQLMYWIQSYRFFSNFFFLRTLLLVINKCLFTISKYCPANSWFLILSALPVALNRVESRVNTFIIIFLKRNLKNSSIWLLLETFLFI